MAELADELIEANIKWQARCAELERQLAERDEQLRKMREALAKYQDAYESTDEWLGDGFSDASVYARAALATSDPTK